MPRPASDNSSAINGQSGSTPKLPLWLLEELAIPNGEASAARAQALAIAQERGARLKKRARRSQLWRHRRRALGVWFSLVFLIAAGTAYVLWSTPTTSAVADALASLRPTHSSSSLPPQGADNAFARAIAPADVTPTSDPSQSTVGKEDAGTGPITARTNPPKSTASVSPLAKVPKQNEGPSAASAIEKTQPAISAGVPAKPDAPAPEVKLTDADRAFFAQRGYELLAAGDIASARLFFERAANAGDALSALGMARTLDPIELAKAGVRGLKGDAAQADYWYQQARSLATGEEQREASKGNPR